MTVALVVPSARKAHLLEFVKAWESVRFWDMLYVILDEPFDGSPPCIDATIITRKDIEEDLGKDSWIIAKYDPGIRCYGFLRAWRNDCSVIVTLDDDCMPLPDVNHFDQHMKALFRTPKWESSIPGLRVRGLPYGKTGVLDNVMLNVGLWRGVPDIDAVSSLALGVPVDFMPPDGSRLLPKDQYVPLCGMNMAFKREYTPLAYFGLQGKGQPYSRFDDIWHGVVGKRICDHLGWSITVGQPHIQHIRASNPYVNIVREAPGFAMNESFWKVVDEIRLTEHTAVGCISEMGYGLRCNCDDYLQSLGKALQIWSSYF